MQDETAEEKLKRLKEEQKALKAQIIEDKEAKREARTVAREKRDKEIDNMRKTLDLVQGEIFDYNRLGKTAKMKSDILKKIAALVGYTS